MVFSKELKKLSVQEFSFISPQLDEGSGYTTSRGHSAEPVKDKDYFRHRGKFITTTHDINNNFESVYENNYRKIKPLRNADNE